MKLGIAILTLGYVFSQFYRAFLAVLAQDLGVDLGATPADLSRASGYWFLAFAAMQIPVGAALDRIGPRITTAVLMTIAGLGAFVFAQASAIWHIEFAMALIGVGCSSVLMASYYIFARVYAPAVFATLAGMVIGIGSLGNIGAALPLTLVVEAVGWRNAMLVLAGTTLAIAALIQIAVKDPERLENAASGTVLDLLKLPAMWVILPLVLVNYAPAAGLRGLWAAPYLADVFDARNITIGTVTLFMGFAMILGNFAYGPLDRIFGTRKWVILTGNALGALCCLTLWAVPLSNPWSAGLLIAAIGFFGSSFPVLVAHSRAFFPAHLVGRGVTLVNLFGIGGVGIMQFVSGPLHTSATATHGVAGGYGTLFLAFGVSVLVGCAIYLLAEDRTS